MTKEEEESTKEQQAVRITTKEFGMMTVESLGDGFVTCNDGKIAFKTCYDRYVTAEKNAARDWVLRAETPEIQAWEEFTPTLIYSDSGKVAFKTYHDRYVTAMDAASDWVLSQTRVYAQ